MTIPIMDGKLMELDRLLASGKGWEPTSDGNPAPGRYEVMIYPRPDVFLFSRSLVKSRSAYLDQFADWNGARTPI